MGQPKKRIAVLLSGRGSNFEALLKACADEDYPAEIVAVASDKPEAFGLKTAADAGIATACFKRADYASKAEHEAALLNFLASIEPDYVCLAGYMRLLSAHFVGSFENRILNIHPSLLPKFPGLDTHQRAIYAGESEHGCTVHLVDAGMDTGPILAQAKVPVLPNDTADDLAARILVEEHKLYAATLKNLIEAE